MKWALLLAVVGVTGCGAIYTSPKVYEEASGAALYSQTDFDVQVVPMTFETVAEANLSPFAPARLPAAFRPRPVAAPPPIGGVGMTMPDLPAPEVSPVGERSAQQGGLPSGATAAERPRDPGAVDLPPPAEPQPYRIGVADVVLLSVNTAGASLEDVPNLITAQSRRQGYVVQDDGAIAIPDVGRVRVLGMTLEEAEGEIFQALVAQRLDPSFSLEIAEFNSQRVSVGGAVRKPTVEPITLKPLYLSEALQIAGGVAAEDIDYTLVRLFRNGRVYQAPLRRLFGDDGLTDVLLRDGDSVFVDADYDVNQARNYFEEQIRLRELDLREREFALRQRQADIDEVQFSISLANFELQKAQLRRELTDMRISIAEYNATRGRDVRSENAEQRAAFIARNDLGAVQRDYAYLAGEARQPQRFVLPFETRAVLADVLFSSQGVNINFGDYAEIYVLRAPRTAAAFGGLTAYHLNAANAVNLMNASTFELRPGDIVFVAEQPITTWSRVINQLLPSVITQAASAATSL